MRIDLRKKPVLFALAAVVIALPAFAFVLGARVGTDTPPQEIGRAHV